MSRVEYQVTIQEGSEDLSCPNASFRGNPANTMIRRQREIPCDNDIQPQAMSLPKAIDDPQTRD